MLKVPRLFGLFACSIPDGRSAPLLCESSSGRIATALQVISKQAVIQESCPRASPDSAATRRYHWCADGLQDGAGLGRRLKQE